MNEIWKSITGYEGYYEVSNTGKVRSLASAKWLRGKELTPLKHKYLRVALSKDNIKSWKSIHRLVAVAFVPNPDSLPEVNHIDGDKFNNNYWNLEWKSSKGNKDHAVENKLYAYGENHGRAKLTEQQVLEIYDFILKRVKTQHIADKYGVSNDVINGIKMGTQWKHLNLKRIKTRGLESNKTLLYV